LKKAEMTQLDRIEIKLDFLFGIMSNELMATEFLQTYHGESGKKDGDNDIIEKSKEMFQYHNKNVKDSITYFVEIFGQESNDRIIDLIKENMDKDGEPEPATKVETVGSNTSEQVS